MALFLNATTMPKREVGRFLQLGIQKSVFHQLMQKPAIRNMDLPKNAMMAWEHMVPCKFIR